MEEIPSPWQKKMAWRAIAALAFLTLGATGVFLIWLTGQVLGYLQPLLVPVAAAAILAYLLDPVVNWLTRRGIKRTPAVLLVFLGFLAFATIVVLTVAPTVYRQSVELYENRQQIQSQVYQEIDALSDWIESKVGTRLSPRAGIEWLQSGAGLEWIQEQIPLLARNLFAFLQRSIGGFLGVFGYILGIFLIPLYLFYFLRESSSIAQNWADYLPLRASHFKEEVVGTLEEINGYLIAFFRGQLIVSLINGALTGLGLFFIIHLPFALLIGVFVGILGIIPYLGVTLCWIPAVLIAIAQDSPWDPWIVTAIFIAVQQIDGFIISPKIIGDTVGLHPLTVILSLLLWAQLFGGLLGALVAVPMTASLKVLFRRYIWERQLQVAAPTAGSP